MMPWRQLRRSCVLCAWFDIHMNWLPPYKFDGYDLTDNTIYLFRYVIIFYTYFYTYILQRHVTFCNMFRCVIMSHSAIYLDVLWCCRGMRSYFVHQMLWYCDLVILWSCDVVMVWYCDLVMLWWCGVVMLWCCDIVMLWCCDIVILWCCDVVMCVTVFVDTDS